MIAKTHTCSLLGIDAVLVEVEVDLASGLPSFSNVGLPDNIVKESKDRVKAAIQNSGYPFPFDKITVNLAPAAIKNERGSLLGVYGPKRREYPDRRAEEKLNRERRLR